MFAEYDPFLVVILGLFVFGFICLGAEPFAIYVWPHIWRLLRRVVREFLYWTVSDEFADDGEEAGDGPSSES
jgi:hypothetical protein